jgi:hypothetical protein
MTKTKQNETPEDKTNKEERLFEEQMERDSKPQDNIELKREFNRRFCEPNKIYHKWNSYQDKDGEWFNYNPDDVWDWLLPHLKDDNKIRRESLRGFINWKVETGWVNMHKISMNPKWTTKEDYRAWIMNQIGNEIEEYLKKEESSDKRSK